MFQFGLMARVVKPFGVRPQEQIAQAAGHQIRPLGDEQDTLQRRTDDKSGVHRFQSGGGLKQGHAGAFIRPEHLQRQPRGNVGSQVADQFVLVLMRVQGHVPIADVVAIAAFLGSGGNGQVFVPFILQGLVGQQTDAADDGGVGR